MLDQGSIDERPGLLVCHEERLHFMSKFRPPRAGLIQNRGAKLRLQVQDPAEEFYRLLMLAGCHGEILVDMSRYSHAFVERLRRASSSLIRSMSWRTGSATASSKVSVSVSAQRLAVR